MHFRENILSEKKGWNIHDIPVISDPIGCIDRYLVDRDIKAINDLFYDLTFLQDFHFFLKRAESVTSHIESMKEPYADDALLELFVRLNINVDLRSRSAKSRHIGAKARWKNVKMLQRRYPNENTHQLLEAEYDYRISSADAAGNNFNVRAMELRHALTCVEQISKIKEVTQMWYWLRIYDLKAQINYYEACMSFHSHEKFVRNSVAACMYNEKARLLEIRLMEDEPVWKDECEHKRIDIAKKWIVTYSELLTRGFLPSGVNRRIYDVIEANVVRLDSLKLQDKALIYAALYSIRRDMGDYNDVAFKDHMVLPTTVSDPVEHIKDVYVARGFVKKRKMFGNGLTMVHPLFKIKIQPVGDISEAEEMIAKTPIPDDLFFHYLIIESSVNASEISRLKEKIVESEEKWNSPLTYRLIVQDENGQYRCEDTLAGII
ncbi:MAG: hypothetical protein Q7J10_05560 [Methanosarcinaceae archaeon]|nr:hypothetical protein [Methanosarcinaceae archaeon]